MIEPKADVHTELANTQRKIEEHLGLSSDRLIFEFSVHDGSTLYGNAYLVIMIFPFLLTEVYNAFFGRFCYRNHDAKLRDLGQH